MCSFSLCSASPESVVHLPSYARDGCALFASSGVADVKELSFKSVKVNTTVYCRSQIL